MKKFLQYLIITIVVGIGGVLIINNVKAEDEIDDSDESSEVFDEISDEVSDEVPELYIKAINPGYGKDNTGEMIEISRKSSGDWISLAGMTVSYTNSSGEQIVVQFPENSFLAGESLLLRLASSPGSELANMTYKIKGSSSGMSQGGGPLMLKYGEEVLDLVCWDESFDCYRKFKSASGESLVRNLKTGKFEFTTEYLPNYEPESYHYEVPSEDGMGEIVAPSQCKGLEFSEILSYYETSKSEQFIEFYNRGSEQILLDGCVVRYKNKNHVLKGIVKPEEYYVYYPEKEGFSLTKNPTNSNTLELIDTDGAKLDSLIYPNGQRKGTAYAFIGYDDFGKEIWRQTYAPTPGAANIFQEFKSCEEGKVLNKETGNCVKVSALKTKVCKEGQFLNILTGRCNKIKTNEEKKCKEGYYLNPETGRCRKIKENNGADYSLEPETYEESSSFVALYAILGVGAAALLYLGYEFRHEILRLFRKVFRRYH